jgi:hypothetical protein
MSKLTKNDEKVRMKQERSRSKTIPKSVKVSTAAILSATAVAASYVRPVQLNVEPMSLIVFLSGIALGWVAGGLIAGVSEAVFSEFNPLGPAAMPVFLAQIGCMVLIGIAGGVFAKFYSRTDPSRTTALKMGIVGANLTLIFDLVTNYGWAMVQGLPYEIVLVFGLPFMVVHMVSNTLFFALAGPIASRYLVNIIAGGRN